MTNKSNFLYPSQRQLRVGEAFRHALASILVSDEMRDPDLNRRAITVTRVLVSGGLRHATVFVVPFGSNDGSDLVMALRRAAPFLRRRVAQIVRVKFVPELSFKIDQGFDHAARIECLLKKARKIDDKAKDSQGSRIRDD